MTRTTGTSMRLPLEGSQDERPASAYADVIIVETDRSGGVAQKDRAGSMIVNRSLP